MDAALLRCRRLRSFRHASGLAAESPPLGRAACLPSQARSVLAALARDDSGDPEWAAAWADLQQRPAAAFPPLLVRAEEQLAEARQRARELRRQGWQSWVDAALAQGGKGGAPL